MLFKPLDVVADEVHFFLQHQFLFWLEAHSYMQTQRNGPGEMLRMLLEWAEVSANMNCSFSLETECLTFVLGPQEQSTGRNCAGLHQV
jgi:hypothetical protein